MYSSLVLAMFFIGSLQTFLVISLVISIILGGIYISVRGNCEYSKVVREDEDKIVNKWVKRGVIFITIWGIVLFITCIIPDQKTVLAYAALKSVDQYNERNENSNLKPDKLVGTGDDIIAVVNSALEKAAKLLEEKK